MAPYYSHSSYLWQVFEPDRLVELVERIYSTVIASGISFDAIAFTGNSGAGVAYPLSAKYGYPLICVRKGESSHGKSIEACNTRIKNFIIVDDQISTGRTIDRILTALPYSKCVGIVLYEHPWQDQGLTDFRGIPTFLAR